LFFRRFTRGRGSVITLALWRFIICTSESSDLLETNLHQKSPARKVQGESLELNHNLETKTLIKQSIKLTKTLLGVGGLVGLILMGGLTANGQEVLMVSKAQAADSGVSVQLNLAKQALSNAAPVVAENVLPPMNHESDNVPQDGFLAKPLVAETTLRKDPKPVVKSVKKTYISTYSAYQLGSAGGHSFPYGYCTYYVASKRPIPWSGNAGTWLSGARAYRFATGSTPQVGAIMVTYEGGRAGHVAYIEAVNGDQVTISEMNFRGFGIISSRVISAGSSVIKGYIY